MPLPTYQGPALTVQKSETLGTLCFGDPKGKQFFRIDLSRSEGEHLYTSLHHRLQKGMRSVSYGGITITLDRPKGFIQEGVDENGVSWTREYQCDYGYIKRTEGGDGEPLDVYYGGWPLSEEAYLVEQVNAQGEFDEWKLMLGFFAENDAKAMYLAHTPERFFRSIMTLPLSMVTEILQIPVSNRKDVVKSLAAKKEEPEVITKSMSVSIQKTEEEGYVLGIVLVPEEEDLQHDIYSEEEVRASCHYWMSQHRNIGYQHKSIIVEGTKGVSPDDPISIVECYLAPVDFEMGEEGQKRRIKKGTWLLGLRLNDPEYRRKVREGEWTGFSIGGRAKRTPEPV